MLNARPSHLGPRTSRRDPQVPIHPGSRVRVEIDGIGAVVDALAKEDVGA